MQISEVSIEPDPANKYSTKTNRAAETFLNENGLSIEQLDYSQRRHILNHIKSKRANKWYVPFMIVLFILNLGLVLVYKHVFSAMTDLLFEPDSKVEVIEDDGSTSYRQVTPRQLEMQRNYGLACAMISISATMVFFSAFTALTAMIGSIFRTRKDEKLLKAFLPALVRSFGNKTEFVNS